MNSAYDDGDLNEVTRRFCSPLSVGRYDFLFIDLDEHYFSMRIRSVVPLGHKEQLMGGGRYFINGMEMTDRWERPAAGSELLWKRLPECSWHEPTDRFRVNITSFTLEVVSRSWPQDRIVFVSELARATYDAALLQTAVGRDIHQAVAKFKNQKVVPTLPSNWRERQDAILSPYQRVASSLSMRTDAFALFMDRGTGKTPCAIQRVCMESLMLETGELEGGIRRRDGGRMMLVLILCPAQVRLNWQREFDKFAHTPGKVSVLRGGLAGRVRKLAEMITAEDGLNFSALIVGYETASKTLDTLSTVPWDLVIADESHYFKDKNTSRFKSMLKLRDAARRRMMLTGTPIGNSPMDLWSQLEFLREGASGFANFKKFREFHGVWERVSHAAQGVSKLIGLKHIPLLQERLAKLSFSVTKDEAGLNLPDKVRSIVEVEMTPYQSEVYSKIQDELAIEFKNQLSSTTDEMTVNHVLTKLLRLAQITSGFITFDGKVDQEGNILKEKRTQELSPLNPKISTVIEMLQDPERDPRAKCIVWCNFIHNITKISEALTAQGIKHGTYYGGVSSNSRDALVDAFNNDPTFKVLVCNPQTAGEGLNLLGYDPRHPEAVDTFCDLEIFFSSNWSAIQRSQAEDRAHRRGTRMPVQVVDLLVPGTIDEEIIARVTHKREMAETALDLRQVLRSVLNLDAEVVAL
jgi:superfamily II DNA or RNA helicase